MLVLIDADTVAFAPAASTTEADPEWIATSRSNEMMERIIAATEATSYEVWLSGDENFRYRVYPEYKANRIGQPRPYWEKACRQFLVDNWGATYSVNCEADDMVGARQTEETIIAHIDKDINMIPGWHYHWGLTRNGVVLKEPHKYFVTPTEADYNFYYQMLVGDTADNIKGLPGIGPKKAEKLLSMGGSAQEWFEIVRDAYSNDEFMEQTGKCLWIWRKPGDIWNMNDTSIS